MRILMISYHTCPLASIEGKETGGMNVYVLELAKALGVLGHQVYLVTRTQAPDNLPDIAVAPNVRLFHLTAGPQTILSKKEMSHYTSDFSYALKQLIVKEQLSFDCIHAHYYQSGNIAVELREILGRSVPIVMTFHTLALMKNLVGRTEGEKEDFARIEAEQRLVQQADHIISPTETERDYLQYLYAADPTKISIISPGVDTTHFSHIEQVTAKKKVGADPSHKLVLFVGRIEPLKGIDALLFAMKILQVRKPELQVCLWIVGGDVSQPVLEWSVELQRLEHLRGELQLESTVQFKGQQQQEHLPDFYNAADLLVMPSHYEAFGMVALEAMACGTPVITSNVTGIATLIDADHEKIITTANNPLLLASQIEYLLTHPQAYAHIQASLQKKAHRLAWPIIAEQIARVYHLVANE